MKSFEEMKKDLLSEAEKLQHKYELSLIVGADYFEPGMMENLGQYCGTFDEEANLLTLRFDVRGTRYDGRTEQIENVKTGESIEIVRDSANKYNSDNFEFFTQSGNSLGNMPAELCNVIAPLYDEKRLSFRKVSVSFCEPISKRSRYATQAILFAEVIISVF